MLYLEDYLEMIEHLPQELRDRFTEMRELDLSVQNNMDSLEKRVRILFNGCRRNELQEPQADTEFNSIRKKYYSVLEDADEKVHLTSQMYDLVERYYRKLDSELYKFKCELEADNNGITEILEKRSLELDASSNSVANQKENRYFGSVSSNNMTRSTSTTDHRSRSKPEKRRDSNLVVGTQIEKRQAISNNITSTPVPAVRATTPHQLLPATPNQSVSSYIGAGNAIAAAASQAIAATQQMQHGRRTASLKASYEAIHNGTGNTSAHDLLLGSRDLTAAAHTSLQVIERDVNVFNTQKKHKKKFASSQANIINNSPSIGSNSNLGGNTTPGQTSITNTPNIMQQHQQQIQSTQSSSSSGIHQPVENDANSLILNENGMVVEQTSEGDWTYDPNEPRYCICNQVSYGDMVACDNQVCPFEWFHYPCVGITSSPKGKWYCPECTASMRRRGSRKN